MKENTLFKKVYEEIAYKQERLKQGKINAIPYPFAKLSKVLPGIVPEQFVGLTTVSGAGKTLVTNALYIQGPFDYWQMYGAAKGFDIKIFFFPLEDSVIMTQKRMMIKALYTKMGIRLPMFRINGFMEGDIMDDRTMRALAGLEAYFEEFLKKVEMIDDVTNPYGIYKRVEDWLLKPENGYIVDEHGTKLNPREVKEAHDAFKPTFYKRTNEDRIDIVVIDNMNNITEEGDMGKWESIDKLCRTYIRKKLVGFYKCSVMLICQQDKTKEKAQYTNSGTIVEDKFVPSLDSISVYKNIDTSVHLMFGLFDPSRYKIPQWNAGGGYYDIERFDAYYRNLSILKSNFAQVGTNTSFFFDGATGNVEELPSAYDKEALEPWYEKAEKLQLDHLGIKPLNVSSLT